jgi:hypothetical protein
MVLQLRTFLSNPYFKLQGNIYEEQEDPEDHIEGFFAKVWNPGEADYSPGGFPKFV